MGKKHAEHLAEQDVASPELVDAVAASLSEETVTPVAEPAQVVEPASSAERIPRCSGRALAVYLLTIVLLALLESGRLQTVLEQADLPGADQAATLVRETARLSGAALVSSAETRLVRQLAVTNTIGAVSSAPPAHRTLAEFALNLPAAPGAAFVPPLPKLEVVQAVQQMRQTDVPVVLIVGDSLIMEGLGPALHRTLRKRTDISVVREGRYSTGLTRADTFNWPDRMKELVSERNPDIILVCLGANDSQDILVDGKRHIAGTPSWQTLYRERADRFLDAATARGATVVWLGLPIMGKPVYEKRIRLLSDVQEAACAADVRCRFQNGIPALTDAAGNYIAFEADPKGQHVRLRYKDMVHVTEAGGQKLVDAAMPLIEQAIADVKAGVPLPIAPAVSPAPTSTTTPAPVTPSGTPPLTQPAVPASPAPATADPLDALLK